MITVKGKILDIPPGEKLLAMEGDNLTEFRQFKITRRSIFGLSYKLDIKKSDGILGIADLEKTEDGDAIILTWKIREGQLHQGALAVQLRAFAPGGVEKWSSKDGVFEVGRSINAVSAFPSPLPSEFSEMEQRVTAAKNDTLAARDEAVQSVEDIGSIADHIDEVAGGVEETAIEVGGLADEVKDNKDIAVIAAESAEYNAGMASSTYTQMQQDMGSRVATLVNGKHDPDQVNYAVIGEQFTVNSKAELDALLASGRAGAEDIGYVLTGYNIDGDPLYDRYTVISDVWVRSAKDASYAEQAAYALQAGGAANSNKVGGMTFLPIHESDFDTGQAAGTLQPGVYVIFSDDEVLP